MAYLNKEISYQQAIESLQKSQSMKQLYIGNQEICDMLRISNLIMFNETEEN